MTIDALATTALCLLIGYPVAYYIARFGGRYRNALCEKGFSFEYSATFRQARTARAIS